MKKLHTTALLLSLAIFGQAANAAVRSSEAKAPKLPEIWEKAGPRERLKATRAAELDADRLLVERIYGVQVDSDSTVGDLALRDDSIAAAASASLVGALLEGEPEYFDDGRVEVVKAVKIEQVIETLRRKTKEKLLSDGTSETVAFDEKTELATEGKVLEVQGNAALPSSLGHQKVMAKRAAELDAYRRLAQRLMDIRIVASLSQVLKGAEPTAIRYLDDGTCEVEMKITKQDIVRAVSNSEKGRAHTTRIEDSIQEKSFVETGRGTMHPVEAATPSPAQEVVQTVVPQAPPAPRKADVFFETETIIRRLIDSKPIHH